jgi:hypothetical protein
MTNDSQTARWPSWALAAMLLASGAASGEPGRITDESAAIAAAKRYTKAQCTTDLPCHFQARREGKRWNVLVELSRRRHPHEAAQKYPGGHVLLYFNEQGQLVRRVEGE